LRIEWALQCEAVAQDGRGALTLVGLNQNIYLVGVLPVTTRRFLVLHLVELTPNTGLSIVVQAKAPDSSVIAESKAEFELGQPIFKDLPASLDYPIELVLSIEKYGVYSMEAYVSDGSGESSEGRVDLYVMEPPSQD